MTKNQIYKCEVCGNIVELLHVGGGELVCCGQPMTLMHEKEKDEGMEKHLPVIQILESKVCKGGDGVLVKVGSIPHPMEEKHYIEWIEISTQDKRGKKHLKPGDKPEVQFDIRSKIIEVRIYCNIHGLWKKSIA